MSDRRDQDSDREEYMSREEMERNQGVQNEWRGGQRRQSSDRVASEMERDQRRRSKGMGGYGPDYGHSSDANQRGDFGEGTGGYGNQSGFGNSQGQPGSVGQGIGHGGQGWMGDGPHSGRGPKGYRRSDERIMEEVCECLSRHGEIDASEIEVSVENGEVTLSGTVDSRESKRAAEAILDEIGGISDVHNRLRVGRNSA